MHIGTYSGCHQKSERSFFFKQYQFPVCARCTGVLIGELLAVVTFFIGLKIDFRLFILFALIMLIDWGIQFIGICESNNIRRLITGILGGFGCWSIFIKIITFVLLWLFK